MPPESLRCKECKTTYALEARSPWYILGFAAACGLGAVYGFLQGAWPFGVVETVWAGVAFRRWMQAAKIGSKIK